MLWFVARTSDRHTPVTAARHYRGLRSEGTPMRYASLRLVPLAIHEDVTASTDVNTEMVIDLGDLMGTNGMQVYPFPPAMNADVMTYQTVVIWDEPMGHAIAAAPLGQP
jgi:hypothetical protein